MKDKLDVWKESQNNFEIHQGKKPMMKAGVKKYKGFHTCFVLSSVLLTYFSVGSQICGTKTAVLSYPICLRDVPDTSIEFLPSRSPSVISRRT